MVELLLQREADVALASEPWTRMRRVSCSVSPSVSRHTKYNGALLDWNFEFIYGVLGKQSL